MGVPSCGSGAASFSHAQSFPFPFHDNKSYTKSCHWTVQCRQWRRDTCIRRKSLSLRSRQGRRVPATRFRIVKNCVAVSSQTSRATAPASEVFEGLDGSDVPVRICETRNLPPAISLDEAIVALQSAVSRLETNSPLSESGTLRFQVPLPPGLKALPWLQSQPQNPFLLPRSYFCPREAREIGKGGTTNGNARQFYKLDATGVGGVAGVGAAVLFNGSSEFSFQDWKSIKRFLSKRHPIIRAYGALRFDPKMEPSAEWDSFGSFYFFIPQIEFCECEGCSLLAVTLAWDEAMNWSFMKALKKALTVMNMVSTRICSDNERPLAQVVQREHVPDEKSWHEAVKETVDSLSASGEYPDSAQPGAHDPCVLNSPALSKVVMARRTRLEMNNQLDPVSLLACLQDKDPSAYQFLVQVPEGSAFIGCSPERLFARDGLLLASEAVAGTRARGSTALKDLQLGLELLQSSKDHFEFEIVRESVRKHMEKVCTHVRTDTSISLLKQARVQHLYARFNGELRDEAGEFDTMASLHPTPAVCGYPQAIAREAISTSEAFDRGLYGGPVGWFGGNGAEFAVGIRSSLIQPSSSNDLQNEQKTRNAGLCDDSGLTKSLGQFQPSLKDRKMGQETKGTCIFLYAGVGVVKDSIPTSEWRELELKTSSFETLLEQRQRLEEVANVNALWATLIVEECCRLGITYFCIAPGSRSSPLTAAAAANPRVTCVSCIDERSMAFHAVGYGRGANKPAAVVTSSGTAVSNLLPGVVEASQDFVPLVVLTADRPAELCDTGANQTIDQGKHFGGFVRYHANLPAADDKLPAKVVLTTVDAAVNRAIIAPSGPVHINCGFREPLAGSPAAWNTACLKGLERWTATSTPYTQYVDCKSRLLGGALPTFASDLEGVAEIIDGAREGLLVVGGLSAAEETWAVALLAQHLGWPVIPDVISGLRIGEALCTEDVSDRKLNIIHNFDQILLSRDVASSSKPDVVLQIGSRLTSKRVSKFLEDSNLQAYILVEDHSSRHDPAHMITHRVQSSTADFSSTIMKFTKSKTPTTFCGQLRLLSNVVAREIQLKLQAESSLTEPFVAHYVVSCLPSGCALFLGNSMPIRDVDMYAHGAIKVLGISQNENSWDQDLPQIGGRVGANRGASGIDGIISTAVGFAAGSRQRVTLLLGDLSFLHDTNGLALLVETSGHPPVTIVVVNNRGGGIFSLLPVVDTMPEDAFTALFSTPHTVQLEKLCQAHGVSHWHVQTKDELQNALQAIHGSPLTWVIEVESKIDQNADFHRFLSRSVGQAVTRAFHILSRFPLELGTGSDHGLRIAEAKYDPHNYPLVAPPTTVTKGPRRGTLRHGFLLTVTLINGSSGIGEIAPLEGLHKETLLDVEEQLIAVVQKLKGRLLDGTLLLLDGSFSNWLSKVVGISEETLFPSLRMGLEMAVFGALAVSQGCSLLELLSGSACSKFTTGSPTDSCYENLNDGVRVCGLLDSEGSPEEAADAAAQLVEEGFCTLKLKVGRRSSPLEDAAMLNLVRKRVGPSIHLRADANRKWSYEEALKFAKALHNCGLQYLEEPLKNPLDIPKFCAQTGLLVALDESLDEGPVNTGEWLQVYACQDVVAAVIKPGRVGGFERAWQIAQWAHMQGMMVVNSSAFESGISLAAYAQFASYVDERLKLATHIASPSRLERITKETSAAVVHGFGTYKWLNANCMQCKKSSTGNSMEISNRDSSAYLENVTSNIQAITPSVVRGQMSIRSFNVDLRSRYGLYSFHVMESTPVPSESSDNAPTILFLHGFMGRAKDWLPIMKCLSLKFRSISVDLPGHGQTIIEEIDQPKFSELGEKIQTCNEEAQSIWSIEGLAAALSDLLNKLDTEKVILVGYSMGARIALYMTLRHSKKVSAAVIVSGSPGLASLSAQKLRAAQDDTLAASLREHSLQPFVHSWYRQSLWNSLRTHPDFEMIKRERLEHQNALRLAKALTSFSTGRQPPLWDELPRSKVPLLLVVGKLDTKFVRIANAMLTACENGCNPSTDLLNSSSNQGHSHSHAEAGELKGQTPELLEVEGCGHAVLIESPLELLRAVRQFAVRHAS